MALALPCHQPPPLAPYPPLPLLAPCPSLPLLIRLPAERFPLKPLALCPPSLALPLPLSCPASASFAPPAVAVVVPATAPALAPALPVTLRASRPPPTPVPPPSLTLRDFSSLSLQDPATAPAAVSARVWREIPLQFWPEWRAAVGSVFSRYLTSLPSQRSDLIPLLLALPGALLPPRTGGRRRCLRELHDRHSNLPDLSSLPLSPRLPVPRLPHPPPRRQRRRPPVRGGSTAPGRAKRRGIRSERWDGREVR